MYWNSFKFLPTSLPQGSRDKMPYFGPFFNYFKNRRDTKSIVGQLLPSKAHIIKSINVKILKVCISVKDMNQKRQI